ncbi:virion core protein, T7 gp14 family [Roseicella aquatilis]|uniref:Uncharacterized protein n=1 Tax=Roseicella aquatilis TaxID=2527868 RepID=A0A4R4DQX8_9PROT|nr:hypothetical protein [Roseicella aquatilis]TCZ64451.1 hypothetical protein EXY23_07335 [Roseicella aquatilis]
MCAPLAIAAASTAISAAGAISDYSAKNAAASDQARYNTQTQIANMRDRNEVMGYQNQVYSQDIQYANDMLAWAEQEWSRQVEYDTEARKAIRKNTLAAVGQVMLRQVEEDMSVILQGTEVRRQGTQARAQIAAKNADRGVEGNSVDAILQDVFRQEGEVVTVMDMNRNASLRQLNREALALDAQGDQQMANLALKTYAPSTQIRSPSPVGSVQSAAPVAGGNVGQLVTGLAGAVGSGFSNYSQMSGKKVSETVSDLRSWAGRQLTL